MDGPLLIGSFASGWSNKAKHTLIKDDAVYLAQDVKIDELGAIACRNLHNPSPVVENLTGAYPIEDFYQVFVEEGVRLIYFRIGTALFCWNSFTNATRTLTTSMTTKHVSYTPLRPFNSDYTHVYITDGTIMACDDGLTYKTWGIDPPDGSVTLSVETGGGDLSVGMYKYVYTFFDATVGIESDPSPACGPLLAANNDAIVVNNIQISPNPRVTSRKLYRTMADGGTFYLVATISDNVSLSFTDIVGDASLLVECNTDQGIPPVGDVAMTYGNVILLSGNSKYPNRLYFCRTYRPDNFPSTFYLDIGSSSNKLVNFGIYGNMAYLITESGVDALYGTTPVASDAGGGSSFINSPTRAHVGTYARWSIASGPDGIYYLAVDGIYRFADKSVRVSDIIQRLFELAPGDWYDVVDRERAPTEARAVSLRGVYYLLVPMKNKAGSVQNKLIVYNTNEPATWYLYDVDCNCLFADTKNSKLFGGLLNATSGNYGMYELFSHDSSSVDTPTPKIVTKAYDIRNVGRYSTARKELTAGLTVRTSQDIGWIKKFRVDGLGAWTFKFYVDSTLRFTKSLTLTASNIDVWYDFDPAIKGRHLYIVIEGTGTTGPRSHKINEIEVQ